MINIIPEKSILETTIDTADGRIKGLIGVHTVPFHADDVFAVAALTIVYPKAQVVQTRDPKVLERCEVVVDVGGVYDPDQNRYDHHQKGGAGARPSSVPYASIGLVWKHFGRRIVSTVTPLVPIPRVLAAVDATLIQALDAVDTGTAPNMGNAYSVSQAISAFNLTWNAKPNDLGFWTAAFCLAVDTAQNILRNEIRRISADVMAVECVEDELNRRRLPYLMVLKEYVPWQNALLNSTNPDANRVEYVMFPDMHNNWRLMAVPLKHAPYQNRRPLPLAWAGLENEALAEVTGVTDATFCHNGRFVCGAKSFEGAFKLAELAHEDGLVLA